MELQGVDLYHLVSWFFVYSFLGWLWESCYVSVKNREIVNRGFVTGPFCTIYGCGAISVYLLLKPVEGNLPVLFLGGILVPTLLEYSTAVLMDKIFHTSWWDYSENKFNFQGRICLGASLLWGILTVLLFRVLQPFVEGIVNMYSVSVGRILLSAVLVGYGVDFVFSASAAFRLSEKLESMDLELERLRQEFREKVGELSAVVPVEQLKGRIEERLDDMMFLRELGEKSSALKEQFLREFREKKNALTKGQSVTIRRFIHSYPNLNKVHLRLEDFRDRRNKGK